MRSKYLSELTNPERDALRKRLFESQGRRCFICDEQMDLVLHAESLQIDHIDPLTQGGRDLPDNFALTHGSCNESKQASNLRVARLLAKFDKIKSDAQKEKRDSATLADVLISFGGSKFALSISVQDDRASFSFPEIGDNAIHESSVYVDSLSKQRSFFAEVPIEYLFHDTTINPRGIGSNLRKLVEEFFRGRPQLHITLSRIENVNGVKRILVFDGQHKAAAQILLGTRRLPVRVFVDPDIDLLLTANTNAGDTLRQVAFDMSVKRRLGHSLYLDRIQRFQHEHGLSEDNFDFSESELISYFKGESREMKRYIIDAVRDSITRDNENRLMEFVDFGGRAKEKPLSISTIEKTFYSFFIYQGILSTPLNYKLDTGENPRELEREQIVRLMNIIAEEIYEGRFTADLGTYRIENRVQQGELIPEPHLVAFRMSKEEILYNWLKYLKSVIQYHFLYIGKKVEDDKLFQEPFPEQLWTNIRNFVKSLKGLPIWVNKELAATVFGGKQNYAYWEHIFKTGTTPQNLRVMNTGLDFMQMIKG